MGRCTARGWLGAIVLASLTTAQIASTGAAGKPPAKAPAKPATMAILDYQVARTDNPQLGSQMADILTARMSVEDSLTLVERSQLAEVVKEQKLTLLGLADPDEAARVGKLLGAKILVIGKAFVMDKKLVIVTKLVGTETGRVVGTIRQVEMSKPISDAVGLLSDDLAELARKKATLLLPKDVVLPDPVAEIAKAVEKAFGKPPSSVAVIVPEHHVRRIVVDPAVETEIKRVLIQCGFRAVDVGKSNLAGWAKGMLKNTRGPWPAALHDADYVVVGEAFSEFAARTGELVTCAARAEVNLIDRKSGRILLADRQTARAVDLTELIAGKTALQSAGHRLAIRICRALLKPPPATAPAKPAKAAP